MTRYIRPQNVDIQPLGDQWIVLDLKGDAYYLLNASARWYFEKLADGESPENLAVLASERYADLAVDQARQDIDALIGELSQSGLLECRDDAH